VRRRDVVRGLPALAVAGCVEERVYAPSRVVASADWPGLGVGADDLFPDGVQSGEARPDSVLLWTHYTGDVALEVVVHAWIDDAWTEAGVFDAVLDAGHEDAGTTHVRVDGLPADRPVAFQFRDADGKLSGIGHTRTAPPPESARTIRFGATSCCSQNNAPFANLGNVAARGDLDFFVWNGDTVYQDGSDTTAEMRATWSENLQTDGFRAIMERTPGIFTWDDHEVDNDWGVPGFITQEREDQAIDVFFEYACVSRDPEVPARLWRSFRFGCVEVFVLDGRSEHDVEAQEYLSAEQFAWFTEGLLASDATWKLVVNSVPIAQMPEAYNVQDLVYEHWNGYPAQRAALIDHLTTNAITGVLFLSGDFHHPGLYRVDAEGPGSAFLDLLVGPAGSRVNALGRIIMDGAQYVWSDAVNNSARFELRPEGLGHVVWVTDEDIAIAEAWFDVHGAITYLDWVPPPP
jgi:alkaline phosphatase D